mmetsp:Transcript_89184/g.257112  ORF Transcript_89184/g.257112 Transcript_89184/m.257112 type:complete len:342 (+) Transcript_89184:623-1648(+)
MCARGVQRRPTITVRCGVVGRPRKQQLHGGQVVASTRDMQGGHPDVRAEVVAGYHWTSMRAVAEQRLCGSQVALGARGVQRCPTIVFGGVRIGAPMKEQSNAVLVAAIAHGVQRGLADGRGARRRRPGVEEATEHRCVALGGGDVHERRRSILVKLLERASHLVQVNGGFGLAGAHCEPEGVDHRADHLGVRQLLRGWSHQLPQEGHQGATRVSANRADPPPSSPAPDASFAEDVAPGAWDRQGLGDLGASSEANAALPVVGLRGWRRAPLRCGVVPLALAGPGAIVPCRLWHTGTAADGAPAAAPAPARAPTWRGHRLVGHCCRGSAIQLLRRSAARCHL